jgi:nicotinamidase-related amidase
MTREQLAPGLVDLVPSLKRHVPPARVLDKQVYSPWVGTSLQAELRKEGFDTLVITGGETDVCVLAAVMGAIDLGYRVVVPTDAVFSSADATHDAMLGIYSSRFGQQLTVCKTQDLLDDWREISL